MLQRKQKRLFIIKIKAGINKKGFKKMNEKIKDAHIGSKLKVLGEKIVVGGKELGV